VRRGINIARYSELADDGSVLLQVGFDIASQNLPSTDRIAIVDLPSAQVVSVIHKGSMDTMADSFDAMIAWATDSGYTLTRPAASSTTNGTTAIRTSTSPSCSYRLPRAPAMFTRKFRLLAPPAA
jgi:hypothetical protein